MKRIKKTLCLMLVLALALGMVPAMTATTAVALEFEDADDIKNVEAASVNNALGIIVGDSVGFRPTDTLTRAEAATIITRMLLGADFAKIYEESRPSSHFTDVSSGQWWSGVIMFTYERGIMYGTNASGTRFSPRDTLTIPQFAIMLMRALGKATTEDYRDGNWIADSVIDARRLGLLDGLSGDFTAPATRDIAAQMAFNALIYSDNPTTRTVTRFLIVQMNPAQGITASVRANLYTSFQAALTAANTDNSSAQYGEHFTIVSVDAQQTVAADSLASEVHGLTSDVIDDPFGRPDGQRNWSRGGRVIYRAAVATPSAGPYYGSVNESTVYTALGLNANATSTAVIVDGYDAGASQTIRRGNTSAIAGSGRGVVTEIYRDGDDITVVIVNTYLGIVGAPTAATASTDRTIPISFYAGADTAAETLTYTTNDFARNNVVLLTFARGLSADYNAAAIHGVELAPTRGDIRLERFVANTSVTFGGETRQYAAKAVYGVASMIRTGFSFTASYDFFLDKFDNIIGARAVSAAPITSLDYLYIYESEATLAGSPSVFGASAAKLLVNAFFLDGSRKVLELEVKTAGNSDVTAAVGNVVPSTVPIVSGDPFVKIGDTYYNLKSTSNATTIQTALNLKAYSYEDDDDYVVLSTRLATTGSPVIEANLIGSTITLATNNGNITGVSGVTNAFANASTRIVSVNTNGTGVQTVTGIGSFPAGTFGAANQIVSVRRGNVITNILVVGGTLVTGTAPAPTSFAVFTGGVQVVPGENNANVTEHQLYVDGALGWYRIMSNSAVSGADLVTAGRAGEIYGFAQGANPNDAALTLTGGIADVAGTARRVNSDANTTDNTFYIVEDTTGLRSVNFAGSVNIYNVSSGTVTSWETEEPLDSLAAGNWVVQITNSQGAATNIFIVPAPDALDITYPGTVTATGAAPGTTAAQYSVTGPADARVGATVTITVTVTRQGATGGSDNNVITPTITLAGGGTAVATPLTRSLAWDAAVDETVTFTFIMPNDDVTITCTAVNTP